MLTLIFLSFEVSSAETISTPRTITVQGTGAINVKPDMASIRAGVSVREKTTEEALSKNNQIMARMFKLVSEFGIAERDIQTSSFRVNPVYGKREPHRTPPIVAYEVANSVTIRLRDLTKVGKILDALARDGANRVNGVSFGLGDSAAHQDKARTLAVENARHRAEVIAKAAKIKLGRIMEIREGSISMPRPVPYARASMVAESAPVAKGELSLSARLTIVFEIE